GWGRHGVRVMAVGEPRPFRLEPPKSIRPEQVFPLHEVIATHLVEDDDHRELRFRRWIRGAGEGDRESKQRNGNPSAAHHGAPNSGIMSRYSGSPGRGRAIGSNPCEFRKLMSDKISSYDRLP